jgi:hypothetical protein
MIDFLFAPPVYIKLVKRGLQVVFSAKAQTLGFELKTKGDFTGKSSIRSYSRSL